MELPQLSQADANLLLDNDVRFEDLEEELSHKIKEGNMAQFVTQLLQQIPHINYSGTRQSLSFAICLLNFYIRENCTGPVIDELPPDVSTAMSQLQYLGMDKIILDGEELVENVRFAYFFTIIEKIMSEIDESVCPVVAWWRLRIFFLHQKILEERSQVCWEKIQKSKVEFESVCSRVQIPSELLAVFYAELSAIYSYYYDIEGAKEFIAKAKELVGISVNPTGVLGKRTKFQQTDLAQLVLQVERTSEVSDTSTNFPSLRTQVFPQAVLLEDEVRLEKINISNELPTNTLRASDLSDIQHLVILAEFQLKQTYLPPDDIYLEELLAYLSFLIDCPKVWSVQLVALLNRSTLEKTHRRTVERSMKQLQTLSRTLQSQCPDVGVRLRYFYATSMPMWWEIESSLAKILSSLNLYKEALDISLRMRKWEDVIQCYTDLGLRHKAEEVIREQLKTNESVKLWTLLGDATDNTEYYEHAWKLSDYKSARAKRQWGYYYFHKKMYKEAVEHLEESLKLNRLENPAWLRLGFAALQIENWEVSSKAYQHSTALDADNFEAWNNLAKAFAELGFKAKALRALKEATKCNFDNWKVWENTLVIATDCKAFDEVIRAYNRLFDLKGKWVDDEILGLLTNAIVTDKPDSSDNSSRERYLGNALKLFGRITASVTNNPKIWKLYADLILVKAEIDKMTDQTEVAQPLEITLYKNVTYSQKSVQAILADPNWSKADDGLNAAVEFSSEYIKSVQHFIEEFPLSPSKTEALTTLQFTLKRVYVTIKKICESAVHSQKFEKLLDTLKESATRIDGLSLP